jgi:hypothetical protein
MVLQAVRDVRTAPPPADQSADPELAPLRAASYILAPLCEQIGEDLEHGLAARRYAMSGDRRALHGTVL